MAHPDYRGQGIGLALWQRALSDAGDRTIGLDGVVAQQDNYRKSGFVYAHANFRYGGEVQCTEPPGTELVSVSPVLCRCWPTTMRGSIRPGGTHSCANG